MCVKNFDVTYDNKKSFKVTPSGSNVYYLLGVLYIYVSLRSFSYISFLFYLLYCQSRRDSCSVE